MNRLKKPISVLLLCAVLMSCVFTSASAADWKTYFTQANAGLDASVTLTPGSNETERYVSWYSDTQTNTVKVAADAEMTDAVSYNAAAVKTAQGDYRACAVINNLEPGKTYFYKCISGEKASSVFPFRTISADNFSAVYVTDVHTDYEEDEDKMAENSVKFNQVLEKANVQRPNAIGLILSAGDQATSGLRSEYTAFTTPALVKSIPLATAIGNHDRKNIDYKYFAFQPNTAKFKVSSYVGTDYWFVKGNVLFLVMDSNNGSMTDHYAFVKEAVAKNSDVKWRVAMFHHDLYGGRIESRESENKLLRVLWAPIADQFGIDLCLLGHSHYYTISNVLYNNKTVASTKDISSVENPQGTIYMVSGSVNHPRALDDNEVPPLGENVGQSILTSDIIYNILDFSDEKITINTYSLEKGEKINTFTITKTSNSGGHNYKTPTAFYAPLLRFLGTVYAFFNNISMYSTYREKGIDIPFFKAIFG